MTVLEQLRQQTRPSHQRLERRLLAPPGLYDSERYGTYLLVLRGIWSVLQARALLDADLLRHLPDLRKSLRKIDSLGRDLCDLGRPLVELPQPALPPGWRSAELFGALYVMEGSQLGGPVLARKLDALGLKLPTAYLLGGSATLSERWRAFCDALEGFATNAEARQGVCDGAVEMFMTVERELGTAGLLDEKLIDAIQ